MPGLARSAREPAAQPVQVGSHRFLRAQALRPDRPLPPDARRPSGGSERLFRGPADGPRRRRATFPQGRPPPQGRPAGGGRSLLAADLNPEASRPVLQRRPRDLRTPHPAEPRRSGRGAGRPSRGPAPLEDGPRRVSRQPRDHVAGESIALNRGASREAAPTRRAPPQSEASQRTRSAPSENEAALLPRPPCLDEPARNDQCGPRLSSDLRVMARNSGPASRKRTLLPNNVFHRTSRAPSPGGRIDVSEW